MRTINLEIGLRNRLWIVGLAAATWLCAACDQKASQTSSATSQTTAAGGAPANDEAAVVAALKKNTTPTQAERDAAIAALPAGHPPIDGGAGAAPRPAQASGPPVEAVFEPPQGWASVPPSNSFRKFQYTIPAKAGDAEGAEVIVYYFGPGQGGSTEANLARWRDQFRDAEGNKLPASAMKTERFKAGEWDVVLCEVAGSFDASMPGAGGGGKTKAGFRMIGGVVEVPSGSYFVKATGPDATISENRDSITKFIMSARPAS